jgi:hypothetical protein
MGFELRVLGSGLVMSLAHCRGGEFRSVHVDMRRGWRRRAWRRRACRRRRRAAAAANANADAADDAAAAKA